MNQTNESMQGTLALDTYTLPSHGTLQTSGAFSSALESHAHPGTYQDESSYQHASHTHAPEQTTTTLKNGRTATLASSTT